MNCRLLSLENEPASVTAIASAILSNSNSSGLDSPNSMSLNYNYTDDDADRSCKGSSASSFGTSPSSASLVSGFSHHSRGSFGSFGSIQHRGRRRRRRRTAPKQGDEKAGLNAPLKTFQCTFCTVCYAFTISCQMPPPTSSNLMPIILPLPLLAV